MVVALSLETSGAGAEPLSRAQDLAPQPARSVWLSPTYQALLTGAFEPSSRHGLGVSLSYEFHVSSKFNLGLGTAYRLYPGDRATHQLGYGAILKHFFSSRWATEDGVHPFVDYGLLLQQTFVEGRSGNSVSHDTRLGAGSVFRYAGASPFVGVAAHYSRLDYFETESRWIPYVDVQIGWAHAF